MKSIGWTGSNGNKVELRARCETEMIEQEIKSDGYVIGTETVAHTDANLELWVDGKKVDSCWDTNGWRLIDTKVNGKAVKKIWGLPVMVTEENIEKVEAFLTEIIEGGKSEEVKESEATEKAKEKAEEIAEAEEIIEASETTPRNDDGTLMTQEQAKAWCTRYNNIHNEGGEGYVPMVITVEAVRHAETVLEK